MKTLKRKNDLRYGLGLRIGMAALLFCFMSSCDTLSGGLKPPRFEYTERLMGTDFSIVLYSADQKRADQAAKAAFERIRKIERVFSDYADNSEVTRLSKSSGSDTQMPVSDELWPVLLFCQDLSRRSEGAFDITVGPYVLLWRQARHSKTYPKAERLKQAAEFVGYQKLEIGRSLNSVKLTAPRMRLDFGAVAKGYAADQALLVLRAHRITMAMVDAGGDIVLGDPPPGRNGWRIFIESSPDEKGLILSNVGIATSGDRYQVLELDGKRYSHIIDPRTGQPVTTPIQVTVIAPNGQLADSLASTVSVMGVEAGRALAKSYGRVLVVAQPLEDE